MKAEETFIKDCFVIYPTLFKDNRGYFFESFNQQKFESLTGLDTKFIQDNQAFSNKGILRGLHFQKGKHSQAKIVRVIKGRVLDVAVDLRKNSKTFGKHFSIILSEENKTQLFVPRGFAHGYIVLEDETIFSYKCDNFYNSEAESGIIYNDKTLNIDWHLQERDFIVSEKDTILPTFEELYK